VAPNAGQRTPLWNRIASGIASSRPGAWLFSRTIHHIDPLLLRLSAGRLSTAQGFPVLLLTTTGAKTGRLRTLPLLYVAHGDGVAIIASRFGNRHHPGWYHNLRANPRATVEIKGKSRECTARPATEAERAEIWARAVVVYPGYERYKERAGRQIPIMVLTPVESD
jgi:deazaflavin-dependent oxidoreductase (nitroreductase family)